MGNLTLHLDIEQMGVGTITSGLGVLSQYLVPVKDYQIEFKIDPINKN
ncbi:hypothetical protein [Dysgonomonas massiliensis]